MIYLDSNTLIRLATADDQKASEEAAAYISRQPKNSIELLDAVLVEVCFVLEFHDYKMKRTDICDFLQIVCDFSQIKDKKHQRKALELFGKHNSLDFTDCLLLEKAQSEKGSIYTFDKELASLC